MRQVRNHDSRPAAVTKTRHQVPTAERALLVGVGWSVRLAFPACRRASRAANRFWELVELARSAGAEIAGTVFQMRDAADPATLVGRGKLDEIRAEARAHKAPLIIFDSNLSPVQQRNIEEATECLVIDRTQLILDIFRASCAEPRRPAVQVELAQLNYMLPRLTGKGTSMSRLGGKRWRRWRRWSGAAERDASRARPRLKRNSKPTPPDSRPRRQDPDQY